MFCAQCGTEIPAASSFCFRCGAGVPSLSGPAPSKPDQLPTSNPAPAQEEGRCRNCGAPVGEGVIYCFECRAKRAAGEHARKSDHTTPPDFAVATMRRHPRTFVGGKRWLLLGSFGVVVAIVLVAVVWSRLSDTPERRLETLANWRTAPPRSVFEAVRYFQEHRDARAVPKLLEIMENREYLKVPAAQHWHSQPTRRRFPAFVGNYNGIPLLPITRRPRSKASSLRRSNALAIKPHLIPSSS